MGDLNLETLRAELDRIDVELLDKLRERIDCCVEIARFKRAQGVPMMQPGRIDIVQRRAAVYGEEYGIDQAFLRRLYELIIDEACRVENRVIGDVPAV
jgi:4-amino-4-deoxychorismate mutase